MADQLGVGRKQLVQERKQAGFVYGQLFGAHEVARLGGLTFTSVATQMKHERSLLEISERSGADLKQILADAKRLNKNIQTELDRVANGGESAETEDATAAYDSSEGSLSDDTADFSPAQIAQAADQVHNSGMHLRNGPFGGGQGAGEALGRTMGTADARRHAVVSEALKLIIFGCRSQCKGTLGRHSTPYVRWAPPRRKVFLR